ARAFAFEGKPVVLEDWRTAWYGYVPGGDRKDPSTLLPMRETALKLDENGDPTAEEKAKMKDKDKAKNLRVQLSSVFCCGDKTVHTAYARLSPLKREIYHKKVDKLCQKIAREVEKRCLYKQGANGKYKKVGMGILVAFFQHMENRSGEPFPHTHMEILNTCYGQDENLRALFADVIVNAHDELAAIWDKGYVDIWHDLGFETEAIYTKVDELNDYLDDVEKTHFSFKIKGMPESVYSLYKERQDEIKDAVNESGNNSHQGKQAAQRDSRDAKADLTPQQLLDKWEKELDAIGVTSEFVESLMTNKTNYKHVAELQTDEELMRGFIREHKEDWFEEGQFKAYVSKQSELYQSEDDINRRAEKIFNDNFLAGFKDKAFYQYYKETINNPETPPEVIEQLQVTVGMNMKFTFKYLHEQNLFVKKYIEDNEQDTSYTVPMEDVLAFIGEQQDKKSKELSKPGKPVDFKYKTDQVNAIKHILTKPGRLKLAQGFAGTGKSTAVECVVNALEAQGFEVWGGAPTAAATTQLSEAFENKKRVLNTAKLIHDANKKKDPLQFKKGKSVLIVDESGMCDHDTWYELTRIAERNEAQIIVVGQDTQLQSVGAPGLHHYIVENKPQHVTVLDQITRQCEDWAKEMVMDFACGRSFDAFAKLHANGDIIITNTEEEKRAKLKEDFFANKNSLNDKLIMSSKNEDCTVINNIIRDKLIEDGEIDEGKEVTLKNGRLQKFSIGDKIVIKKNQMVSDDYGYDTRVDNSERAEVIGFVKNKKTGLFQIKVKTADQAGKKGKTVTLNPERHDFDLSYATTVHKNQGNTKEDVFAAPSASMWNLHLAYVMMSRHKGSAKMYLSKEMLDIILEKSDTKIPSTDKQKFCVSSIASKLGIDVDPEELDSFKYCRAFLTEHLYTLEDYKPTLPPELEDFLSFIEAAAKTNFKQTTLDYELIDNDVFDTYKNFKAQFDEKRETFSDKPIDAFAKAKQKFEESLAKAEAKKLAEAEKEKTATSTQKKVPVLKPKSAGGQSNFEFEAT
ncbi:MAG TPA: AAA family ATPase, partial [Anaerovoracaceae bacterium]|nr:AAA family ATPase [Anaerovoracaceae bacterium]